MLETSFGLSYFLKTPKKKTNIRYIYLRVIVDGIPRETSTKRKWDMQRWDQETERAIGSKEDAKALNQFLDMMVLKISKFKTDLIYAEKTITAQRIIDFVLSCHFHPLVHAAEHHWPERSVKQASPLWEKPAAGWRDDLPRPVHLLSRPEAIEVTAVLPDYPPMLFRHKGKLCKVNKADGPERIEQEWWLSDGLYRDYYIVEDENGARYWLFRSGPYDGKQPEWFIHGFFA